MAEPRRWKREKAHLSSWEPTRSRFWAVTTVRHRAGCQEEIDDDLAEATGGDSDQPLHTTMRWFVGSSRHPAR